MASEWKAIQKKTFTRWCNVQLKKQFTEIADLATDFQDGIKLIILMEVLSNKKVGRYNKKPRIHAQKMENLDLAIKFITKTEHIRLVNIGGVDIAKGNQKLILGLIWTLILHYQISFGLDQVDGGRGPSAKQALLEWLQRKLPDKKIVNFTKDWNDGTLIAALVDAMAPGLCPGHHSMDPRNALENATHAMQLAEDWLDVPQVLGPDDMINPHVDELSMMTYLSKYPTCELKPGAPVSSEALPSKLPPPSRPTQSEQSKVKVYGRGVEKEGLKADVNTTDFLIDVAEAGGEGYIDVRCSGPNGPLEVGITQEDDSVFRCTYEVSGAGKYVVEVDYDKQPAAQSPYEVQVASLTKPDQVKAYGPGLKQIIVEQPAEFTVDTSNAGSGNVGVEIDGPMKCQAKCVDKGNGIFHYTYVPMKMGSYTVIIAFSGTLIPGSPFQVSCELPAGKPDLVRAYGLGLERAIIQEKAEFTVDASKGGNGNIGVNIEGPEECQVNSSEKGDSIFNCSYIATKPGTYTISITFAGTHIPGSPFRVNCNYLAGKPNQVRAYGSGLEQAYVDRQAEFNIDTSKGGNGKVVVDIDGPSECHVNCVEKGDGIFYCTYRATKPGTYKVIVKFDNAHIPDSPFRVHCDLPPPAPDQVIAKGLGLEKAIIQQSADFTIDTSKGGNGNVCIEMEGPTECRVKSVEKGEGIYHCSYTATEKGTYKIIIKFANMHIPGSPFQMQCECPPGKPDKVRAFGSGLEKATVQQLAEFTVDSSAGGYGEVNVKIEGPGKCNENCVDIGEGQFYCTYIAQKQGTYKIIITFAGVQIPGSPFTMHSENPPANPEKVRAYGPGLRRADVLLPAEFTIDASNAGPGEVGVEIDGPADCQAICMDNNDGTFHCTYIATKPGVYDIYITYASEDLHGSPFQVCCERPPPDASKCAIIGIENPGKFKVDCRNAGGNGLLVVGVCGAYLPCESIEVKHNGDYTFNVLYEIDEPGEATISLSWHGKQLEGSPYTVVIP